MRWRWVQAVLCVSCCVALVGGGVFVWLAYNSDKHVQADRVSVLACADKKKTHGREQDPAAILTITLLACRSQLRASGHWR